MRYVVDDAAAAWVMRIFHWFVHERQSLSWIVRELNEKEGLTVLVVEQDARIALQSASSAYVLEVGRVAVSGSSDELRENESVRRSYLGY